MGLLSPAADVSELLMDALLAASMCIMRTALEVMTALRMALSMLGLYPPATSVPKPTCKNSPSTRGRFGGSFTPKG